MPPAHTPAAFTVRYPCLIAAINSRDTSEISVSGKTQTDIVMSWLSTICIRSPDPAVAASRIAGSESFRPSQLLIRNLRFKDDTISFIAEVHVSGIRIVWSLPYTLIISKPVGIPAEINT
ncbi:Uncharacterised protein [Escherichia coli]|uniref:Uncharacterized protein n=1 Tax=Escherichia coli TaxID=562 RepID=A0A377A3G2_ECOLX|nr:Uncharacterised protein [Escherichia coli]